MLSKKLESYVNPFVSQFALQARVNFFAITGYSVDTYWSQSAPFSSPDATLEEAFRAAKDEEILTRPAFEHPAA